MEPAVVDVTEGYGDGNLLRVEIPANGETKASGETRKSVGRVLVRWDPGGTADKWRLGKPHLPGRRRSGDWVRL
jgi:hypothetical protein